MKKIFLLIDNFPPDLGPPSFRFESIVKELENRGFYITVLTAYPTRINNIKNLEPNYSSRTEVIRIARFELNENLYMRMYSFIKFFFLSIREGIIKSKDSDIIIATSPQLLTGFSGAIISFINKKKFILDIRDLWPDVVIDMKFMSRYNIIYIFSKIIEKIMYKKANYITYNSPSFYEYLSRNNKSLELIMNGIDESILEYFKKEDSYKVKKTNKNIKILYAGNIGVAQNIKILIESFKKYPQNNIEIILIGKGSQKTQIMDYIRDNKIDYVKLIDPLPRVELLKNYIEADILFLHLDNIEMFKKTIPSKIFEYLATRKPILFGLEGISREILENKFKVPYYFEPNNIDALNRTYLKLIDDIKTKKVRVTDINYLEKNYLRETLSKKYCDLIEKIIKKKD